MSKWGRIFFTGLLTASMFTHTLAVNAQEALEEEKKKAKEVVQADPLAVTMALQGDSFFGFNPSVYGTYKMSEDFAIAFNATWWTDISGLGVHDSNMWVETDLGVNLTFLQKRLSITPMIGFVHGMLLSSRGGTFPNGDGSRNERTTAFEGVVPNITMNWLSDKFEGEFYAGYYKSIREEGGKAGEAGANPCTQVGTAELSCLSAQRGLGGRGSWDFLHYWVNAGYRVNTVFSFGAHYEHLLSTMASATAPGGGPAAGYQQDYYRWIGPYLAFNLPKGMSFRFTFGKDMADGEDFYKLRFTKTF
ncbi:MAG: uncharacterized protein K0S79_306 [Nitrospira sp.]|jgi:hypothetical protein|nr:uncharacterized protein [Nitrospira sp.]